MPDVLQRINGDPPLAVAAIANPVLALVELGYELSDELKEDIVRRARFSRAEAKQLAELGKQIDDAADRHVSPDDPGDLERLLVHEFGLSLPDECQEGVPPSTGRRLSRGEVAAGAGWMRDTSVGSSWTDPLEALREQHPVMEPLLAYRSLDARRPPLAEATTYDALRAGRMATPITGVRARLQEPEQGG